MLFVILLVLLILLVVIVLLVLLLIVLVVERHHAFERMQLVAFRFDCLGQVKQAVGVLQNGVRVTRLKPSTVHDDQICIGDGANVVNRQLEGVRVGAGRYQCSDADAIATDLADPVGDDLRRDHDVQRLAVVCLRLILLLLALRCAGSSARG